MYVLQNAKAYAKKVIQYIPTVGWSWKFAESIFLERNWLNDKQIIGTQINELASYSDVIWVIIASAFYIKFLSFDFSILLIFNFSHCLHFQSSIIVS